MRTNKVVICQAVEKFICLEAVVIPAPDSEIRGQAPAGIQQPIEKTGFPFSRE
jgi:hypothetical protein